MYRHCGDWRLVIVSADMCLGTSMHALALGPASLFREALKDSRRRNEDLIEDLM